ncbi:hypothetical protein Gotur_024747 [Gossypium turneri]
MLSVKYELESDRGQELALLLRKIRVLVNLETNRPTKHCYGTRSKTKDMDQRMERLEQSQKEMQEQLQKQMNEQQKMIDKMMESQGSMMAQLTKWFNKGTDKGKGSMLNIEEGDNEGPAGSGSNPRANFVNPAIPDFEKAGKEKMNDELQKQVEEKYKWLEEKFRAMVVSPHYLKPLQPLCPKWYDANAQCDYHAGIEGHSIEHCTTFKKLVERLISIGVVKLDDLPSTENSLPNHNDNGVNMIGGSMGRKIKEDIAEVKIPLRWVWRNMVKRGLIILNSERSFERMKNYYEFHHEEGHEIQECAEFRALVQGLMDNKEMEFYEEVKEEGSICTSESSKVPRVAQPVVIISRPKMDEVRTPVMPRIIIKKPATFSYQDIRKVPWSYECNTIVPGKETTKDQCGSANPEPMKGFVNAAFVPKGSKILVPKLSKTTEMGLQLLVGKGALPGKGLGKYLQGRIVRGKQDYFGLGYKPDRGQRKTELEKRQERRRARLSGEETKWEPMIIPHVSKNFVSRGVIHAKGKYRLRKALKKRWEICTSMLFMSRRMKRGAG